MIAAAATTQPPGLGAVRTLMDATKTRLFLIAMLTTVFCSQAHAGNPLPLPAEHDWTVNIGRHTFGLVGYSKGTYIHDGLGSFWVGLPIHAVAGIAVLLLLLTRLKEATLRRGVRRTV